jgi:hypothetical protein
LAPSFGAASALLLLHVRSRHGSAAVRTGAIERVMSTGSRHVSFAAAR